MSEEAGNAGEAGDDVAATVPKTRIFLVVVDDSPEAKVALRYASLRALRTGGRVALLHVLEPVAMDSFMSLDEMLREEQRAEAEQKLQRLAREVLRLSGRPPCLIIREGALRDELLALLDEDAGISVLVLGAGAGSDGPGPLISHLTTRALGRLRIPLTIVPGNITDQELDAIS